MAAASSSTGKSESSLFKISGSTSSSTTQKQQHFDVFINHRGPDVKMNLASPIYHVLELLGVKAFFDREELNLGDLIPQAIEDAIGNALIYIAIFSKGYAESPWCLEELSLMLKTKAPIIPVFYCVEPGDLKWRKCEVYREAFSKHETSGRYDKETLEKWKSAVHQASIFMGCEFKENGDLGLLLRSIVERVQEELQYERVPFKAATYTVGLDDAVRGIESTIRSAPAHVQIVGIVGMGGCGKTTLATEIYNRNFKAFDDCSFLSEVKKANLAELQKQLLEDILYFRDISMSNASRFLSTLTRRFKTKSPRVLIVLDDVDHGDQLDALLPDKGATLGAGSLIIVTARDSGVLTKWGISCIHQMTKLDQRHAKKLFCWHAFKGASPPDAFRGLIKEFVSACHGLPLSIKVIAERLYKEPEEIWKSELEKISKLLPEDITERLKLSYYALDIQERNVFLDVACFFVGEKKNLAKAVWEAAGWSSLESLVKKCLVEVDKQNRIRMHDHLRHLGRTIANECSPCRLWSTEQITRIRSCTKEIRGIMAATTQFVESYAHDEFPTCCDHYPTPFERCKDLEFCSLLQLLVVAENCFPSDFAGLTADLVWLRWFNCQHTELPSWLSFKNLRVLELYGACSLRLWEDNAPPPKELSEILITAREGNSFNTFPSKILGLERLTKIALISYHGEEFLFKRLPPELCDLHSLEHLELRYCKNLSKLPDHFGKLRKLRYLDLCWCQDLRSLPDSFTQLVNLEHLDLSGCGKLLPMPYMLQNMTKLVNLYFSGQAKLKVLPLHIPKQKFLRELYIKKTELIHVPEKIGELGKLETLVIGSPHLTGFPTSFGHLSSLTRLKITGCIKLESLPETVECLKHLEHLFIKSCAEIRSLPGLRQMTNLQNLKIFYCPIANLDLGPGSSSMGKLKVIHLKATDMTRLSISQDCCPKLETLQLDLNDRLFKIDILSTSVKKVEVSECAKLRNINGILQLVTPETSEITLKHKKDWVRCDYSGYAVRRLNSVNGKLQLPSNPIELGNQMVFQRVKPEYIFVEKHHFPRIGRDCFASMSSTHFLYKDLQLAFLIINITLVCYTFLD